MLNKIYFSSILDFIFPNVCLHCLCKLKKNYFYFCKDCLRDFSFVAPKNNSDSFAVFENFGAVNTFLKEIRKQQILSLIKIAAAFIVIQHSKIKLPVPNIVLPLSKKLFLKDHVYYLAKEVAKFFNIKKKQNKENILLIVSDIMDIEKFEKLKKQLSYNKIYSLSLCFDMFFDDLNLSK